jgi:hypothetical protein
MQKDSNWNLSPPRPENKVLAMFTFVFVALAIASFVSLGFMAGISLFYSARMAIQGPPSMGALKRTEGALVYREPCWSSRGGPKHQGVTIESVTGLTRANIPCLINDPIFLQSQVRHIVVLSDERHFSDSEVYEVDFDGAPLLAYADHVATNRLDSRSRAVFDLLQATVFVVIAVYMLRTNVKRAT